MKKIKKWLVAAFISGTVFIQTMTFIPSVALAACNNAGHEILIKYINNGNLRNGKSNMVTKKGMKNLCNELIDWIGVQVSGNIKLGTKVTYIMSKEIRGDIIAHVPDYSKETYGNYNEWNKVSLRLFGKKTPNVQEPVVGDWGLSEPVIKNIKVKTNEKNKYKVKADINFRNYDDGFGSYSYDEKVGHIVIYLKKNDKSSYGAAITKIDIKSIKEVGA